MSEVIDLNRTDIVALALAAPTEWAKIEIPQPIYARLQDEGMLVDRPGRGIEISAKGRETLTRVIDAWANGIALRADYAFADMLYGRREAKDAEQAAVMAAIAKLKSKVHGEKRIRDRPRILGGWGSHRRMNKILATALWDFFDDVEEAQRAAK